MLLVLIIGSMIGLIVAAVALPKIFFDTLH